MVSGRPGLLLIVFMVKTFHPAPVDITVKKAGAKLLRTQAVWMHCRSMCVNVLA
jgi:hypothetical protein